MKNIPKIIIFLCFFFYPLREGYQDNRRTRSDKNEGE